MYVQRVIHNNKQLENYMKGNTFIEVFQLHNLPLKLNFYKNWTLKKKVYECFQSQKYSE